MIYSNMRLFTISHSGNTLAFCVWIIFAKIRIFRSNLTFLCCVMLQPYIMRTRTDIKCRPSTKSQRMYHSLQFLPYQLNVGWSYEKLAKMILTITVPCQGWYIQFCLFCVFYHRQVFSYKFSMLCNFFVDLKIHPWSASFKKFNVSVLKRDVGSIGWCHHLFLQSFFAPRMSDRLLFHGSSSSSSLSVVFFPAIFIIFVIITFVLFHFSSALSPRSPN